MNATDLYEIDNDVELAAMMDEKFPSNPKISWRGDWFGFIIYFLISIVDFSFVAPEHRN